MGVSDIMRKAMDLWMSRRRSGQLALAAMSRKKCLALGERNEEENMRYATNNLSQKSKRSERNEDVQNLISLRISDREKKMLEKLVRSASMGISDIMREAMDLWLSERRRLCLD
jgi:hypothetical protein